MMLTSAEAFLGEEPERVLKKIEAKGLGPRWGPVKTAFSKTNRGCFAADIADDEQNIETRGVEALKLAEHDETRHL